MTESEAIEELKYDCNELGKAIPCDTSWGCSFENAYGMAIQALEKQIPKKVKNSGERIPFEWYCPTCGELLCDDGYKDTDIKYFLPIRESSFIIFSTFVISAPDN